MLALLLTALGRIVGGSGKRIRGGANRYTGRYTDKDAHGAAKQAGTTSIATIDDATRFIGTMLGGWAYGAIYRSSTARAAALDGWLHYSNYQRQHSAIGRQPPSTA